MQQIAVQMRSHHLHSVTTMKVTVSHSLDYVYRADRNPQQENDQVIPLPPIGNLVTFIPYILSFSSLLFPSLPLSPVLVEGTHWRLIVLLVVVGLLLVVSAVFLSFKTVREAIHAYYLRVTGNYNELPMNSDSQHPGSTHPVKERTGDALEMTEITFNRIHEAGVGNDQI